MKGFAASKYKDKILLKEKSCAKNAHKFADEIFEKSEVEGDANALIDVTVPEYRSLQIDHRSQRWMQLDARALSVRDHQDFDLRQIVRENLGQPCFQQTAQNRYITKFGCRAHSVSNKAGMWIDKKEHISIFMINDFHHSPFQKNCVLVGSRTVNAGKIPTLFWEDYDRFIKFSEISDRNPVCFLSDKGGSTILTFLDGGAS